MLKEPLVNINQETKLFLMLLRALPNWNISEPEAQNEIR
jgi:hypothetical protein